MPGRTSRKNLEIIGFVFGLIISFVTWNILGFLSTPLLVRIFWTVMAFGGGISGLIFLITYLEYEYSLYKDNQNKSTKSSDLADSEPSGFKLYSPKGFIVFLFVTCILIGGAVTVVGVLVGANAMSAFIEGVKIGVYTAVLVYMIWYRFRNSRFGQKKQDAPKKLPITRGQTVLEAEYHRLTEVQLDEIHNLHELTRINLGLNQLTTIDLSPLAGSTKLKELILYMNHLESIDLSPLASCSNLEYLDLTDNNLESIDLTPLASCTKLDALNIGINKTSDIDLSPLSECRDLKILTIDGMGLREVELSPLKNCTKLEFLKLDDNELVSLDVTPLFECNSLTDFPIDKIELTTTLSQAIEDWPIGVRKHAKRFRKS
jgi:hypothetical protein